nr:MAG TPA: protein of unknown function (DUF1883) [Caudoviricetes sp.]
MGLKYNYSQEYLQKGDIVRVTLDKQANVILLDSSNYQNFRNGRRYSYYGGLAKVSPCDIVVPRTGQWYIVINLGGYSGSVKYSINIIR